MQFKSALTWFGLLAVTFTAWPAAAWASPAPQKSQNLLTNPGFEGQFVAQADDFQVASGWAAWWLTPPGAAQPRPNFESTDHAERVHSGAMAQLIGSFYDIHTAGVYQQAAVKAGDDLRLSVYGKGWTSEKDAPLNVSVGGTDLRMRVGIDPFGGVDPASPNVVWSEQVNAADSWYRFEAYARAQSNTVTVFAYSSPKDPRRRNYVFWDDAELVALTGDAAATAQAHYPTPTPTPIVYTPTPETVALGQNLLQNPGFEGRFYTPCTWKADLIPWNHIPCEPWYGKEVMTRWNTVITPESWAAWWRTPITDANRSDFYTYPSHCPKDAPEGCKAWHNPEYSGTDWIVVGPRRIRSDKNSLRYFTFWSVHEAGVFQTVGGLTPGTQLRFSAYMEAWSATESASGEEPSPYVSGEQTGMHMKIGIDPTGGRDPWSPAIIWSPEFDSYDQFSYYQVTAAAQSGTVTVYIYSRPEKDNKHNDVYVDDTELVAVSIPGVSAAPAPTQPPGQPAPAPAVPHVTSTPLPDGSLVHTVVPGDTLFGLSLQYQVSMEQILQLNAITQDALLQIGQKLVIALPAAPGPPAPAPQPTAAPEAGAAAPVSGKLCIRAFEDTNADIIYTAGESLVSGVVFLLQNADGAIVATRTTDGLEPYCFEQAAGNYSLRIQTPAGRVATSGSRWGVALGPDTRIDIDFGSRSAAPEGNSVASRAATSDEGAGRAVSALLGAGLLASAGGLGWWLWMRRRQA